MKNIALLIFMVFSLVEVSTLIAQDGVQLHLEGDNDADLTDGSGMLQIGNTGALQMLLDNNEILVKNNTSPQTLYINSTGGNVSHGAYIRSGLDSENPYFKVHNESGVGSGGITIDLNLPADVTSAAQMMIVQVHRFSGGTNYRPISIGVFNTLAITVNEVIPAGTAYRVTIIYRNNI